VPPATLRVLLTHRDPRRVAILSRMFQAATEAEVEIVHDREPTVERLTDHQATAPTPYDVLLTNDIVLLEAARVAGLMRPATTPALLAAVPPRFRAADGSWFGIGYGGRVVVVSQDRVAEDTINYADLSEPRFKGRLCMRSGLDRYNLSLFAAVVATIGEEASRRWLAGVKANLARQPEGDDRDQLRAIVTGRCDVAVVNHQELYPLPDAASVVEEIGWQASMKVLVPADPLRGTHVTVFAAAVLAGGRQPDMAEQFVTFLATGAQDALSVAYYDYPVNPTAMPAAVLPTWLVPDDSARSDVARHVPIARMLVEEIAFDDGRVN
jgi:iron(III) transport system substrate-binding protein